MHLSVSETRVPNRNSESALGGCEIINIKKHIRARKRRCLEKKKQWRTFSLLQAMTIIQKMRMGWLRWAGHVVRMDPSDIVMLLFLYNPGGKRKEGGPKLRWHGVERERENGCNGQKPLARSASAGRKPTKFIAPLMMMIFVKGTFRQDRSVVVASVKINV